VHRTARAFAAFFLLDAGARLKGAKETFHVSFFFHSGQKYFCHARRRFQKAAQRIARAEFTATLQEIFSRFIYHSLVP